MAALKDSDRRARCELVYDALRHLLTSPESDPSPALTRRDFFTSSNRTSAHHVRAASSRVWQQPVLDRLVRGRFLDKEDRDGTVVYTLHDAELVRGLLNDWKDEGLTLTRLVFPADVTLDDVSQRKDDLVVSEAKAVGSEVAEAESELDVAERVGNALVQLIKMLDHQNTSIAGRFTELAGVLCNIRDGMLNLAEYQDQLSANVGSIEKRLGGNNKRLDDVETRLSEVSKKLDKSATSGGGASLTRVVEGLALESTVHQLGADIGEDLERCTASIDRVHGVCASITKQLEARREDQIANTLHALEGNINDQQALRDLLLGLVSEEKPSDHD